MLHAVVIITAVCALVCPLQSFAQYYQPTITPPPPAGYPGQPLVNLADSVMMPFPVMQTVPRTYEDLLADQLGYDLAIPSNITTDAEYDPQTGCYIIRTRVGDTDIATPFMLTP